MYVRIYIYVHLYMCSPERRIIAAALPLFSKAIAIVATKEPRSVNVYIYISIYYKLFFFFFAFIVTCAFFPDFSPRQTRIRIRSTVCVCIILCQRRVYIRTLGVVKKFMGSFYDRAGGLICELHSRGDAHLCVYVKVDDLQRA